MTIWTEPQFAEIDMSAEIGSYQQDFEPREDLPERVSPPVEEADA
jgi:hypothetical protein